jgi:hypothetical protein
MLGWQPAPDPSWPGGPGAPAQPAPGPGMPTAGPGPGAPYAVPMAAPDVTAAIRPATGLPQIVMTAVRRAFRLSIDPSEVTDGERTALEAAARPVTDRRVQAFMTWRRSVHMVVAVALVPLLFFDIAEVVHSKGAPGALRALTVVQLLVDLAFTALLWVELRRWTEWHDRRRLLALGWLGYFLLPFLLYLYPLRSAFDGSLGAGMVASVLVTIQLMPRAISTMPGLLRGAMTAKLLFPGASGPGWLMLILAPIYALLLYVVLVIPYQMTGSGYFVPAMLGLIGAQVWLGRMGYELARPQRLEDVMVLLRKVRGPYVALTLFGLVFVLIGLSSMLRQFEIPIWIGIHAILLLLVSVLLLTLLATDWIVVNLARGQSSLRMPGTSEAQTELARDIAQFEDPPSA